MMTPTVALDGREFLPDLQTGIGRYLSALVDHVRQHPPRWGLVVVGPPGVEPPAGVPVQTVGIQDGYAWDLFHLPRHLTRMGAAAFVTPYLKFRPPKGYAVLVLVCDPTDALPEPGSRRAWTRPLIRARRRLLARRAALVVTISEWSRGEIAGILRLSRERVRVIYPGIPLPPAGLSPAGSTAYILHLSNGKPHKNVARLLEAYAGLPPALRARYSLVLAGIQAVQRPGIVEAVQTRGLGTRVEVRGAITESALSELYADAVLFAFPSLTEGFGIPPLEAMAHAVPVVASTAGALPEVLGDAALLVDPLDARALREAIEAALTNRELRERLAFRGLARARAFPVERTGAALAEAVEEVLSRRVAA